MNVMKEKNGRLLSLDVLRDTCAAGCLYNGLLQFDFETQML
jgi:hypothetical protein